MKKLYIGLLFASGLFTASAQNYEFQDVIDVEQIEIIFLNAILLKLNLNLPLPLKTKINLKL